MNIESFLAHYQLTENPFSAEEARVDPVFDGATGGTTQHPDFPKLLGTIQDPSTAIVFGERGSGKTAIRLLIGRHVRRHNQLSPQERVLVVPYDEFNTMLDNLKNHRGRSPEQVLNDIRLEDHQDAILSLATTRLVDAIVGEHHEDEPVDLPEDLKKVLKQMPRQRRVDLAILAAQYDDPRSTPPVQRWKALRSKLKLGWRASPDLVRNFSLGLAVISVVAGAYVWSTSLESMWLAGMTIMAAGLSMVGLVNWLLRRLKLRRLARQANSEIGVVHRPIGDLEDMLGRLRGRDLPQELFPENEAAGDSRYQRTRTLLEILRHLDHIGMIVLVDRVDEPTMVSGEAVRMKQLVWPMFDNKFLKQRRVGIKLLLPLELHRLLRAESPQFYQKARPDKQSLVERLTWSGVTLYDLCTRRLQACRGADPDSLSLRDLFEEDVTADLLVATLDQMHQPRDAFKLLYSAIQEHCRRVPDDQGNFNISRSTLEAVRQEHSRRLQELYRGLSPA